MVASLLFRRLMPEHHYIPLMTVMSLPHILWLRRVESEAQHRPRHMKPHAGEQAAYEENEFTDGFDRAPSVGLPVEWSPDTPGQGDHSQERPGVLGRTCRLFECGMLPQDRTLTDT